LIEAEVEELVRRLINDLPERCRTVFLLNRQEGLSSREIAEALSLSESTVRVQIKIAVDRIGQIVYETAHQLLDFGLYQPAIGSVFAVGGGISVDQRGGNLLERRCGGSKTSTPTSTSSRATRRTGI